nr:hypothetical protein [Chthoniobacterales bacterium]
MNCSQLFRQSGGSAKQIVSALLLAALGKPWLLCLVLFLAGVGVRSPSLNGQFIWDDFYLAHDSPLIKSPLFVLEAFRHFLFLDSFSTHYRPAQCVSYILDYFLWHEDSSGFHLSNLLWHSSAGVLLFLLLRKLFATWCANQSDLEADRATQNIVASFLVAFLWTVHPVHSAAVDYISGRADSLAFFFACGGWLLFLRGKEMASSLGRTIIYAAAGISGLLALCSREIAGIWLGLFLLHLLVFEKRGSRRLKQAAVIGCLLLTAAYIGLRHLPRDRTNPPVAVGWSAPVRSALMLRALGDYGRLMLYPSSLHMERSVVDPANYRTSQSWKQSVASEYLSIAGLGVLAVFVAGAFKKGQGRTVRIFGASWFFLSY